MSPITSNQIYENAEIINNGNNLYRITSLTYSSEKLLLNGMGAKHGDGRFHRIHQYTSYIANNVLICIAEKLFHMYHEAFKKLNNNSYHEFRACASSDQILVAFRPNQLNDLIHIDSSVALRSYQLNPSTIITPNLRYRPLQNAADQMRRLQKKGIVYNSARHSQGQAAALFLDNKDLIFKITANCKIKLSLMDEDLTLNADDSRFDPTSQRLSTSIGHFAFDITDYNLYEYQLFPSIPSEGMVNFFRVPYTNYPRDAVRR